MSSAPKPAKVALIVKRSAYDRVKDQPTDPLHALLRSGDPTVANVMRAHEEHTSTVAEVTAALAATGSDVTRIRKRRTPFDDTPFDLVITVGGDGTLLNASHSVSTTPVLGINSAPSSSVGFFCGARMGEVASHLKAALSGKMKRIRLARMRVSLNGEVISARVLNDVLFCHQSPAATSRYIIEHRGRVAEHKSSGLWVGPAAGSTAAQSSAGGKVLPFSSRQLQLVVREPYTPDGKPCPLTHLLVRQGENVLLRSKSRQMRMYIDGPDHMARVGLGDLVDFRVSEQPLELLGLGKRRRDDM